MKIAILGATSQIASDLIVSFSSLAESVSLTRMAKMQHEIAAERINRL